MFGRFARSHPLLAVLTLAAIAAVPFVVAAIWAATNASYSDARAGDLAVIELSTRDVGDHPVLLGTYSRFGWHHPGPALFYVYAAPFTLFGRSPHALSLAAIVVAAAAPVGIAWVAFRRGGAPLLVWTVIVLELYIAAGGAVVTDIWNPWVTILPFGLVVFLSWSVACRDWWALPVLVAVGSFVVQAHAGYMPAVALAGVYAIVVGGIRITRDRTRPDTRTLRWAATIALGIVVVVWAPPIVDQLTNEPGNLGDIVTYARNGGEHHGWQTASTRVAAQLGVLPARIAGETDGLFGRGRDLAHWTTVTSLLALGGAAAVAWWRRSATLGALVGLVAALLVVATFALTRIEGPLEPYLVQWVSVLAVPLWVAAGGAVIDGTRRWSSRPGARLLDAGVLVAVVSAAASAIWAATTITPDHVRQREERTVRAIADEAETALRASHESVVVRVGDPGAFEEAAGLVLRLESAGHDVTVDQDSKAEVSLLFDDWRLGPVTDDAVLFAVASTPDGSARLTTRRANSG